MEPDEQFLLQAMENPDFLIKNKLEQIVENFKVSLSLIQKPVGIRSGSLKRFVSWCHSRGECSSTPLERLKHRWFQ